MSNDHLGVADYRDAICNEVSIRISNEFNLSNVSTRVLLSVEARCFFTSFIWASQKPFMWEHEPERTASSYFWIDPRVIAAYKFRSLLLAPKKLVGIPRRITKLVKAMRKVSMESDVMSSIWQVFVSEQTNQAK